MQPDPLHLHTNRLSRGVNVVFLLIPAIAFVLVLSFILFNRSKNTQKQEIATTAEPSILGEEVELDSSFQFKAK